jgi:hypothetical protein
MSIAFKVGASLKSGLDNFGSLGSWVEIDVEVDDPDIDPERLIEAVKRYQQFADQLVQVEQSRKETRYPTAAAAAPAPPPAAYPPQQPQPQYAAPPAAAAPPRRASNGGPPAPQRGGGGGRRWGGGGGGGTNGGGKNGPPQNGKQLLGWASSHGYRKALFELGDQYESEYGKINQWDKGMCDWAVGQLEAGPTDDGQEGPAY